MKYFLPLSRLILIIFFVVLSCKKGCALEKWAVTVYGAQLSGDTLADTLSFSAHYEDSYLAAVALSRKLGTFIDTVDFEVEGQLVQHFGDQTHQEINGLIVARWLPFPWDKYLDTTFAIGNGLSYATDTPEVEARAHDENSQLLNYLMLELAFALKEKSPWKFVIRIHHRSGVYGIFNGVEGASNAIGAGIRYTF
jgi:hypothetical protein